ncbi:hypothetical protein ACJ73_09397 [Blastomyces percursus]|uniref:Retrotransposon gag domain-containing protein n=1 Tax=Blastomyces percursus TaxID=1658174 RepID=A0A1J9PWB5_9EURO|nr:hypothetical protein ACJ73_09397 [Blastomyces percursus]
MEQTNVPSDAGEGEPSGQSLTDAEEDLVEGPGRSRRGSLTQRTPTSNDDAPQEDPARKVQRLREKLDEISLANEARALQRRIEREEAVARDEIPPHEFDLPTRPPVSNYMEDFKLPNPENYYGKDMKDCTRFLAGMEKQFRMRPRLVDDTQRIGWTIIFIRGKVQEDWDTMASDPHAKMPETWDDFKKWVKNQVAPERTRGLAVMEEYHGAMQKPDQTLEENMDTPLPEWVRVSLIRCKLLQYLRQELAQYEGKLETLAALRDQAVLYESIHKPKTQTSGDKGKPVRPAKPNKRGISVSQGHGASQADAHGQNPSRDRRRKEPLPRLSEEEFKKRKDNGLCLTCGSKDHFVNVRALVRT